jgi:hypothetical protein
MLVGILSVDAARPARSFSKPGLSRARTSIATSDGARKSLIFMRGSMAAESRLEFNLHSSGSLQAHGAGKPASGSSAVLPFAALKRWELSPKRRSSRMGGASSAIRIFAE